MIRSSNALCRDTNFYARHNNKAVSLNHSLVASFQKQVFGEFRIRCRTNSTRSSRLTQIDVFRRNANSREMVLA